VDRENVLRAIIPGTVWMRCFPCTGEVIDSATDTQWFRLYFIHRLTCLNWSSLRPIHT
jgi:hypothetical protein